MRSVIRAGRRSGRRRSRLAGCVSTSVGQCVENRALPMVSAVDRIEVARSAGRDVAVVVTDPQGGGAVVHIVRDADVRAEIEGRRMLSGASVPSGLSRAGIASRIGECAAC